MNNETGTDIDYSSLESFLKSFLEKNFKKFKELVEDTPQEKLCALQQAFNLKSWSPNYDDELHRLYYFLRYTVPYCVEYREIYRKILASNMLNKASSISVLSIGCGSMLDLVGLKYAMEEIEHPLPLFYHGIDPVDWNCTEIKNIPNISIEFTENNLGQSSPSKRIYPYNIIIFPRSISDIPSHERKIFFHKLQNKNISSTIALAISKRGASIDDTLKIKAVRDIIQTRHNYMQNGHILILGENNLDQHFIDFLDKKSKYDIESTLEDIMIYIKNIADNEQCTECLKKCSFTRPSMKNIAYDYEDLNTGISHRQINAEPIIYYLQRHGN